MVTIMLFTVRFAAQMLLLFTVWCSGTSASDAVSILPSTQALSLIVKEVTGDVRLPLLPANVSPHDFSLKPSHIRRLQGAELVVWLGPKVEPYLAKVMAQIPDHQQFIINQGQLALEYGQHPWTSPEYLLQGLQQLSLRMGKDWDGDAWLNQMNKLKQQLLAHQFTLTQKNQGYLVYHDGIGGFEGYFGLQHLASFTGADDQPPGAKRLATIAQLAQEQKVACVLIDHEVRPKLVNAVLSPSIDRITIDILATNSDSLIGYVNELQKAVLSCGADK